jgi:hypothetical protein
MDNRTQFFDICAVVRDSYGAEIRKANKAYEEREREIRNGYKGQLAQKEFADNREKREKAREAAADKAKRVIEEHYLKACALEEARVSCLTVGSEMLKALDGLAGLPISKAEFDIIANACANKSYWITAKLRKIAEENGIINPALDATFTTKKQALDTAKDRLLEYIEKPDKIDELNIYTTDQAFRKLESDFSGGFVHYEMDAKKQAAVLLDGAKAGDVLTTAVRVSNLLETASEEVRKEIIKTVGADNSYWENVRNMGLASVLKEYETEKKQTTKEALKYTKDARLAPEVAKLTEAERAAALFGSSTDKDNTGSNRKIDKQGLAFLKTEEGAAKVREFSASLRKAEAYAADKKAEAEARKALEEG